MDIFLNVWFWLVLAFVLMSAELVIPGGIIIFLGIAGLLVAICTQLGIVETWASALTLWFVSSLVLVVLLRSIAQKMVGGDSTVANTDEKVDMFGKEVEVLEPIGPGQNAGRIQFRGTQWRALGNGEIMQAGSKAKVVTVENITVIVEAVVNNELSD